MEKKIKVLQFPISNAKGGLTQYALRNWEFIDKSRFQFDFATMSKKLDFADELTQQGCKIHYISCYAEDDEEQFIKEMNLALDEGYDAVHIHTLYWKSLLVERLAQEKKVPIIIVHSHNTGVDIIDDAKRNAGIELHEKQKAIFDTRMATHFCACSGLAGDWLFGKQIPRKRILILNNAVDTERFAYNPVVREQYREELGLENCLVLGHVGRMVYAKNHKMLLDIFKQVYDNNHSARLLLVGEGSLMETIQQQAREYEIEDKVLFLGKREDVANILQAMDVFVFPSQFEGLPITLIEAQSAGLPCLASEYISREAEVTPNITFLPYQVSEWSKMILYILKEFVRTDMTDAVSKKKYSLKGQIKVIEKIYSGGGDLQ